MRYLFGFLVAIGLIILIIVLMFSGGGGAKKAQIQSTAKTLYSYANTDAEVSMIIDGPVNADQNHQEVKVTVGTNSVVYQQINGYDGSVVNEKTFHNTQASYTAFLKALSYAGFTDGNTDKALSDEQGRCPLGERYVFGLNDDGNQLERFWSTSCGGAKTYLGNIFGTLTLFQQQVPGYQTLTSGLILTQ